MALTLPSNQTMLVKWEYVPPHMEVLFDNMSLLKPEDHIRLSLTWGGINLDFPVVAHRRYHNWNQPFTAHNLKGIGGGCAVKGVGIVTYFIPCPHKSDFEIQIEQTLYVPSCPPSHWYVNMKGLHNASFQTYKGGATWIHEGASIIFSFHPKTKLPMCNAHHQKDYQKCSMNLDNSDSEHSFDILQA